MKFTAKQFEQMAYTAHDPNAAEKAAAILNGSLDPRTVVHDPFARRRLPASELKLEALNLLLEFHGVESLVPDGEVKPIALYLNAGDAYAETVVLVNGEFHLTTWGDYLEEWERAQAAEVEDD